MHVTKIFATVHLAAPDAVPTLTRIIYSNDKLREIGNTTLYLTRLQILTTIKVLEPVNVRRLRGWRNAQS